ncbi:MAG: hypothetical protein RI907_3369 [Pseudomonadota bacterium]|jgi:hypothetical protein
MKFAMKSIVAAASFVAVAAAQAASVTVVTDGVTVSNGVTATGAGTLRFSQNLASALKLGGVTVGAFGDGASFVPVPIKNAAGKTLYTTYDISAKINSLTYDSVSGAVTQVKSSGGATQDMAENLDISASGGKAAVGNLDVRFAADKSVEIYGSIVGTNYGTNTDVNYSGLLFTVASTAVSGVTSFTTTPGTYNTTLGVLAISDAGFQALVDVFGLEEGLTGYNSLKAATTNFGSLSSSIIVTAAGGVVTPPAGVPEPSTYALMGLGLVGMSLVARRRAK